MATRAKPTNVDGNVLFDGPANALGVSGGTAAFYRVKLKQPIQGSKSHYIAKDLAHAIDEVEFYEIAKRLSNSPGWGLLDFMLEYKGVAKMPTSSESGQTGVKDLLIMLNLFDGKKKLRLLDIKIGKYTASANWRGKSAMAARRQSVVDAKTNSAKEGYRMEGFDGPPRELVSFNPTEESILMKRLFSSRKSKRFQYQSMSAKRFLSWFLDCREAAASVNFNYGMHVSNAEFGEAILRRITVKMASLCKRLNEVPCPQKWLGSSIAFSFDAGELPRRGTDLAAKEPTVHIFDWGRSELLSKESFDNLSDADKQDRTRYWNFYCDGVCRLFYESMRAYFHRFCTPAWSHIKVEVLDYDAASEVDFAGECTIPLCETGGPRAFALLDYNGDPVQKHGKKCHVYVSMKRRQVPQPSSVPASWLVTVHKADQIPNLDKIGCAECFNFAGWKSDGFLLVTAFNESTGSSFQFTASPTESSACIMDTNHPVWEETFEFGLCDPSNMTRLLQDCGLGSQNMGRLNTWFTPERNRDHSSDAQADAAEKAGWEEFQRHISASGFGSAFRGSQGLERLLGPSLPQHGPRSLAVPALTPKFFEQGVGLNPHLTVPPVIFHGHGFAQALPRAF